MLKRSIDALRQVGLTEVIAIGSNALPQDCQLLPGLQRVSDIEPGSGPLGAIASLEDSAVGRALVGRDALVIPVDLLAPNATDFDTLLTCAADVVSRSVGESNAGVVATVDGRVRYDIAFWSSRARRIARTRVTAGERALRSVIDDSWTNVELSVACLDADAPSDLSDIGYIVEMNQIEEISVLDLNGLGIDDVKIVDVRETHEFESGRIATAVHVPLGTVADCLERFSANERNYIVCKSGGRSMQACQILAEQGFDVVNVAGGTLAWIDAGFPVASGT